MTSHNFDETSSTAVINSANDGKLENDMKASASGQGPDLSDKKSGYISAEKDGTVKNTSSAEGNLNQLTKSDGDCEKGIIIDTKHTGPSENNNIHLVEESKQFQTDNGQKGSGEQTIPRKQKEVNIDKKQIEERRTNTSIRLNTEAGSSSHSSDLPLSVQESKEPRNSQTGNLSYSAVLQSKKESKGKSEVLFHILYIVFALFN